MHDWRVTLALWTAVVLWSGSFLGTRVLVLQIPPFTAAAVRFALAAVLLLVALWLAGGKFPALPRRAWGGVTLYGSLAVTLGYALENVGMQRTSAGNSSVIISLIPAVTIVLARFVLGELLTVRQWAGVALATAGSLLLVGQGQAIGLSDPLGDALLFLTTIVNALSGIVGKRNLTTVPPLLNVAWGFAIGTVLFLPFVLWEWAFTPFTWNLDTRGGIALAYLSILASAAAYSVFYWAMARTTLVQAALPNYFTCVLTLGLSAALLGETLTIGRVLAACVVIAGLVLASRRPTGQSQ
jgi:drug/metabolite transporter (DMT)-like permease